MKLKEQKIVFRIVPPFSFDTSTYFDSIGYFIEQVFEFAPETKEVYSFLIKDVYFMNAKESPDHDIYKTQITAIFNPEKVTVEEIQERLLQIGIPTSVIKVGK